MDYSQLGQTTALRLGLHNYLTNRFGRHNVTPVVACFDLNKLDVGLECKLTHAGITYQIWVPQTLEYTQVVNYLKQFYPELFI